MKYDMKTLMSMIQEHAQEIEERYDIEGMAFDEASGKIYVDGGNFERLPREIEFEHGGQRYTLDTTPRRFIPRPGEGLELSRGRERCEGGSRG